MKSNGKVIYYFKFWSHGNVNGQQKIIKLKKEAMVMGEKRGSDGNWLFWYQWLTLKNKVKDKWNFNYNCCNGEKCT